LERRHKMFSRALFPALIVLVLTLIPYGSTHSQTLDLIHDWSGGFPAGSASEDTYVDIDPSGNVFWAGRFYGTLNTGCETRTSRGDWDIFLVKFDQSGTCVWDTIFGDASSQTCTGVATDPSGNVVIAGGFSGTLNFGGDDLSTGNLYVAKFDASGNHIWSDEYLSSASIKCYSIASDLSGNTIITGCFRGTVNFGGDDLTGTGSYYGDVFVAKFDPSGNHIWSNSFGDTWEEFAYDVVTDQSGNIIITGGFSGSIDFGDGPRSSLGSYDMFLAKFYPGGTLDWSDTYGPEYDGNEVFGFNLDVDQFGNIVVAGSMEGIVLFQEDPPLVAGYSPTLFVASFDPDGVGLASATLTEITTGEPPTGGFYDHIDMELDGAGNIYLGGTYFISSYVCGIGTPTASHNMFLVKLMLSFYEYTCIWGQRFGEGEARCYDIAVDEMGNVVMTGRFDTAIDFGGDLYSDPGFCLAGFTQYDTDGDGIANEIDVEPTSFSAEFSDVPLGGVTTGRIVDRYWTRIQNPTVITVKDEPAPEGVRCIVDAQRGSFNVCGEMAGIDLEQGEYTVITCGSVTLTAGDGPVQSLLGPDVSAEVSIGTSMEVEALGGGQSEIENLAGSTGSVFVTVGDDTTELTAGETMMAAIPEGPPICQVSTDTLDLGSVHPGYSNEETFVIKNIGASILSGQVLGNCGRIYVDSLPGHHLAAGDSLVVSAYFEPTSLGTYYCEVQTGNDDCGTVVLKGVCEYQASVPDGGDRQETGSRAYLGACRPNPANSAILVPVTVRDPGRVRLSLYDARGRLVRELYEGVLEAGTYEIPWNGKTDGGKPAAPGVYLCRMVAGSATDMKRFVVLR
jgi:hypothetical protein